MKRTDADIDELLSRGVSAFIDPDGAFKKKLKTAPERIVIKFGVDLTRPDLHLGHAVVLRKLRQFQDLGCKVIFLIGDYTTMIGDPTGKSKVRPEVSQQEIETNLKTFLTQVNKILKVEFDSAGNVIDTPIFSWIRNSDWFVSITDIAPGPDSKTNITIAEDGKEKNYPIPPNSFVGKTVLFENTRMQKNRLKNDNIYTRSLSNILWVLRHITHARLIERDMFQERITSGQELYMHELMYPVLQGIDSEVLHRIYGSCDLEVGGSDQTFNMLMGRDVMKLNKQEPQAVLAFDLLVGTDGKEKMSKSLDNYVGITDTPEDMYGKIMSVPDSVIPHYFELCTFTPSDDVLEIKKMLEDGGKKSQNPRDIKMRLAREIVAIYHGEKSAQKAEDNFVHTFQKGGAPENVAEVKTEKGTALSEVLVAEKMAESKTDFRRLISEGAIKIISADGAEEKITDPAAVISEDTLIKVGKHRFIRIVIQ